jgi:hypothetical protein
MNHQLNNSRKNKMQIKKVTQDVLNTMQPDDKPFVCIMEAIEAEGCFNVEFYATESEAFAKWPLDDDYFDGALYCGVSVDFELYCGEH